MEAAEPACASTPWRRAWPCTSSSSKVTPDGLLEELTAREAFGRAAEPFEVANVIVFLASDYSSYMTGEKSWPSQQPAPLA